MIARAYSESIFHFICVRMKFVPYDECLKNWIIYKEDSIIKEFTYDLGVLGDGRIFFIFFVDRIEEKVAQLH